MSEIKTGGFAFPLQQPLLSDNLGMTMRDYFAAKALPQTMIEFDRDWHKHAYEQDTFLMWAAERAYAMADAMLAARKKGGAK